ncbi:MAG TPA: CHASE2 domain-containing protein, partial [Gallionella sp.]|nr:CHASE2 domain-containing protein [Gallionella sp.]
MSKKSQSDLWILAAAFVLTGLISLTPPYQRLDSWLGDAQQSLVARETYFRDAFVIDIDEASLTSLEPYLGTWPYRRDAYALVLDYLSDMGAEVVVFDIQLATPREKDDAFAASMRRNGNAVLVASAPASGGAISAADKERLRQFAWRTPPNLSAHAWPTVLMPAPALTEKLSGDMQLGMVSLNEDADGVLRRIPLMHDIAGVRLPSLPLAVLAHGRERTLEYDGAAGRALFGGASWPVDETGNFHLAYPKNANSVMTMPFRQVVEAALGAVHLEDAAKFFKGKTIFIGSSAQLSDRAVTPRGVMSGTAVLAIAHQSLKQNMLLAPQRAAWNGAMIVLALLPVLISILVFRREPRRMVMVMISGIVAVYAANLLLLSRQQQSVLLFPLLLIGFGWLLFAIRQQGMLRRHNVRLIGQTRALEQANLELQTTASTDSLTGLLVRRAFLERCV